MLSELGTCLNTLYENDKEDIEQRGEFINEDSFVDMFFEPFKQAFPAFWTSLAKELRRYPTQEGIGELCEIVGEYDRCSTDEQALELLLDAMQKYPHFVLLKELAGHTYVVKAVFAWYHIVRPLDKLNLSDSYTLRRNTMK